MDIRQNDIIVRTFQDSSTLWVSERYICNKLGEKMNEYLRMSGRKNYKKSVSPCHQSKDILPATGKSWRYARINGQFYYDYDFIPNRADTQYRSRLGDKDSLLHAVDEVAARSKEMTRKEAEEYMIRTVMGRQNSEDIQYYMFKEIDGVCKFNQDKARQLAEALNWLRVVREMVNSKKYELLGINRQKDFFELCGAILERRNLYGFNVTTGGSLRKKLVYFPLNEDEQYEYLISGRWGNNNARRLGKEKLVDTATGEIYTIDIHQAIITDLWMNPGNAGKASKIDIWNDYLEEMEYMGVKPLSYSALCHYTKSYDHRFKTEKERHGEKWFNNTYLPYISGKKPVFANSLWCADGSGTIGYRYYDKEGKMRSMRLYVMMVSDVATGKIVGWCPQRPGQHSESDYMLREAMLMGLRGCGKREVMEMITDNGPVFTSGEGRSFLELVCRNHRTITPGNSQANYGETQFRLFKKRLRRMINWMGTSWDAKSIENKANADYINIADYPTYEEAIGQLEQKIAEWNNKKLRTGVSRTQLYDENLHPDCQEIDDRIWRKIAGRFTPKKEITASRGTIILESRGIKYEFDIPDYECLGEVVQSYLGYANTVKLSFYWDDECADAYTKDGRYIFSCYNTPKAATSHAEADDESMRALGKGMHRKAKTHKKVDSFIEEAKTVAGLIHGEEPEPYDITCRQTKHAKERSNEVQERALESMVHNSKTAKAQLKQQQKEALKEREKFEKAREAYLESEVDFNEYL